jgi:hypothetical protein
LPRSLRQAKPVIVEERDPGFPQGPLDGSAHHLKRLRLPLSKSRRPQRDRGKPIPPKPKNRLKRYFLYF